jgi:Tfp pilus assembly protein PilZ
MKVEPVRTFHLSFGSLRELEQAIRRRKDNQGFYFRSVRPLFKGDPVVLLISVGRLKNPIRIEGSVASLHRRTGQIDLPTDIFVGLNDEEMVRLTATIEHYSEQQQIERRIHDRLPVKIPGCYHLEGEEYRCFTGDLSKGGAYLESQGPLPKIGERVRLILSPPSPNEKDIKLNATVVWISESASRRGMGVQFGDGQPQTKKIARMLRMFRKTLKHTEPKLNENNQDSIITFDD